MSRVEDFWKLIEDSIEDSISSFWERRKTIISMAIDVRLFGFILTALMPIYLMSLQLLGIIEEIVDLPYTIICMAAITIFWFNELYFTVSQLFYMMDEESLFWRLGRYSSKGMVALISILCILQISKNSIPILYSIPLYFTYVTSILVVALTFVSDLLVKDVGRAYYKAFVRNHLDMIDRLNRLYKSEREEEEEDFESED